MKSKCVCVERSGHSLLPFLTFPFLDQYFFPCITHAFNLAYLHRNHRVRDSAFACTSPVSQVNGIQLSPPGYFQMGHHYQADPSWGSVHGSATPRCPSEDRKLLGEHLSGNCWVPRMELDSEATKMSQN